MGDYRWLVPAWDRAMGCPPLGEIRRTVRLPAVEQADPAPREVALFGIATHDARRYTFKLRIPCIVERYSTFLQPGQWLYHRASSLVARSDNRCVA